MKNKKKRNKEQHIDIKKGNKTRTRMQQTKRKLPHTNKQMVKYKFLHTYICLSINMYVYIQSNAQTVIV